MTTVLTTLALVEGALRTLFLVAGLAVGVLAALSWAVRTRRLNPFGSVGQLVRRRVDPLFAPVERRALRFGASPVNAPWFALFAVVLAGIVTLSLLGFVRGQLALLAMAGASGPRGWLVLAVRWTFGVLQLALFARVISSWFSLSPWSPWIRWAYVLTEWFLAPLRRVIPQLGMIDVTPLVAWLALSILEGIVVAAL